MKCPNCGSECISNRCALCGTVVSKNNFSLWEIILKISRLKWLNFLFPISSDIFVILMGLLLSTAITQDGDPIPFYLWLYLMAMLFLLFVMPYNTIRWFTWGRKRYEKKIFNKAKILEEIEPMLTRARTLAGIINTTVDISTFESSLSELKAIFNYLTQFEKYDIFTGSTPQQDLNYIIAKEGDARNELHNRIIRSSLSSVQNTTSHVMNYDNMDGHAFEFFCADLLKKNGFINVKVTQGSGDHGIDILAEKNDISYAIQCKCYSSNIGNAAVQQAHTGKSLYRRDIAVVMTNQYFTSQAKEEAAQLSVKLWDRDRLDEFINNARPETN